MWRNAMIVDTVSSPDSSCRLSDLRILSNISEVLEILFGFLSLSPSLFNYILGISNKNNINS